MAEAAGDGPSRPSEGKGGDAPGNGRGAALLAGVDRAAFAVALGLCLRRSGVAVGTTAIQAFVRALGAWEPRSRSTLYWMARVTLVQRSGDLEAFDAVFAAVFAGGGLALDPAARRAPGTAGPSPSRGQYRSVAGSAALEVAGEGLPWATLPAPVASAGDDEEAPLDLPERLPSRLAAVAEVPFEQLDPADLALLDDWLAEGLRRWPTRPSRRWEPHHSGRRVGLRPTVAAARRTGFEPVALVRTRPRRRPRRVVMLCDVSRSMQPYVAAYLHLQRAAAVATEAEVFAFATSLTRLTPVLAHASAEAAIEEATARVDDRFGGTRIAASLRSLLSSRHGESCRGALVVIASDGWDTDPPEAMVAAMSRLRRRAHRVLWLNPRLAAPGYQPLVGGMAAALPYCDAVLPADRVAALGEVVGALVAAR